MQTPDDAIRERFPHAQIIDTDTFDKDLDHIRQLGNQVYAGIQQLSASDREALLGRWILK